VPLGPSPNIACQRRSVRAVLDRYGCSSPPPDYQGFRGRVRVGPIERRDFSAAINALEPIAGKLERIGGSRPARPGGVHAVGGLCQSGPPERCAPDAERTASRLLAHTRRRVCRPITKCAGSRLNAGWRRSLWPSRGLQPPDRRGRRWHAHHPVRGQHHRHLCGAPPRLAQAKTSNRQADKERTVAPDVGHLFRQDAWVGP